MILQRPFSAELLQEYGLSLIHICAEKENERKNVLEEEKEKLVLQIQDLEAEKKDMEKQQVQAAEQKENQEEQKEELPGEQKSSQGLDGISGVISNQIASGMEPVSYTHLDVYKRQE